MGDRSKRIVEGSYNASGIPARNMEVIARERHARVFLFALGVAFICQKTIPQIASTVTCWHYIMNLAPHYELSTCECEDNPMETFPFEAFLYFTLSILADLFPRLL